MADLSIERISAVVTSQIVESGDHAGAQDRRGRRVALSRNHFKLLARRWVYASQILAAAQDAAGSTCCSCSIFAGVLLSLASLRPIEACNQPNPSARSCHSQRARGPPSTDRTLPVRSALAATPRSAAVVNRADDPS